MTEITKNNRSPLFEVLPSSRCKPEQVARWSERVKSPTYTLLREMCSLDELNEYDHFMAIWRDNETLTYVAPRGSHADPILDDNQRSMFLNFCARGPSVEIVGPTDHAIAETAAYFLSLETPIAETISSRLFVRGGNFRAVESPCLTQIFDIAPSRDLEFRFTSLSAEQGTLLATRSCPVRLTFTSCSFDDGGTAFVEALETRKLSLNGAHLKRLLQVRMIDRLSLSLLASDELALLAFSAQADSLSYDVDSSSLLEADLQSLNIVTKKLSVTIYHDDTTFPTESTVYFFQRLAELGHLVELKVEFYLRAEDEDEDLDAPIPDCIVKGLIDVALANPNLKVLNLCDYQFDWGVHLENVFEHLKDHRGLRTIKVNVYDDDEDEAFGTNFCHLRQFLSHNRNVTVTGEDGTVYTDGDWIDELYALNHFFRGSAGLALGPPSERPSLVATVLLESASGDFQRSALLLSNHLDVLCEVIQSAW